MPETVHADNVSIVLHRPKFPENIGAAARAMRNMGMSRLVVVEPEDYDLPRVLKMATHAAADIVAKVKIHPDLKTALSPYQYIVGTTARLGRQRRRISTPSKVAVNLISIAMENQVAVLFGPEDRGLSNEALRYCDVLVNIPTARFSSLNLAQAVMIMCYEIHGARPPGAAEEFVPRLAQRHELEGMYEQLKEILLRIDFIKPDNPDYWLNNLRRFFSRIQLQAKEVRLIRGVCRQINWYGNKCFEDGMNAHKKMEGAEDSRGQG
ncbi:MAG: RNA methyltransferase [Desulfobacterales bacterium]|nr:RNA methyltransferase [Desulfobacterales bacterium]